MNRKREKVKSTWLNVESPRKLQKNCVGVAQSTCEDGDAQDGGMSEVSSPGLNTSTGSAGLGHMENMCLSTPRSSPKTRLKLTRRHRAVSRKKSQGEVSSNKNYIFVYFNCRNISISKFAYV